MNWRILDIRIGRANRKEFLFVTISLFLIILCLQDTSFIITLGVYTLSFIFGSIIYVARAHDLNAKDSLLTKLFLISITPPLLLFGILAFLTLDPYGAMLYSGGIVGLILFYLLILISLLPAAIIAAGSYIFLSYMEGNLVDNEHGYPSSKIRFKIFYLRTHITKTPSTETIEFTGRDIK